MINTPNNPTVNEEPLNWKEEAGWSDAQMELLYAYGYQAFQSGKYEEALSFFSFLRELDPQSYRYAFSIAACYHRLHNYERALDYYLRCQGLDPNAPLAYFYISDCFSHIGKNDRAIVMLKNTIAHAENQPKYKKLIERAKLELSLLQK